MKPTTWFTPLARPPFAREHHGPDGPPDSLRVLEISSRSPQPLGRQLSAMFLEDPASGKPVEAVYQAAKCYGPEGGPAGRVLANGFDAKQLDRTRCRAGRLRGFDDGRLFWPAETGTQFYDRLWIRSARAAGVGAVDYDAFTDRFHRRGHALACQARSMAMLQGMARARVLDRLDDPMAFSELMDQGFAAGPTDESRRSEIRVAVTGSPRFGDAEVVRRKLDELAERASPHPLRLLHGGAGELDAAVEAWARETGTPAAAYPADWDAHPKAAGYRANEALLASGDPHVVVGFPDYDGKRPRHLLHEARERRLEVEQVVVEGGEAWTHTADGKLADLAAMGNALGRTRLHAPVEGPGELAAARLANGDPAIDGEIRIAVAPGPSGENRAALRAKLDAVRERSAPAALRLAFEETVATSSAAAVAHEWARTSGVRCDMYLRAEAGDTSAGLARRILDEQDPHLLLGGRAMPRAWADAAERAGVPIETVTTNGWTRVSGTGPAELGTEEARSRGRADPADGVVKPVPGRSARSVARRLGERAADAPWAQPGAPAGDAELLNLREAGAFEKVRTGAAVRIDRNTKWGNPFPLARGAGADERREVVEQYREVLAARIDSGQVDLAELAALDGRPLACHCAPEPCHGGPLSQAAAWAAGIEREREAAQKPRAPQRDGRLDEALGTVEVDVDDIPAWDDGADLEPEAAVAAHACEPGKSSVDAINRRRDVLERHGASGEQLKRYDDAVYELESRLLDAPPDDRLDALRAGHPDAARVAAAEAHVERMREGGASEAQLERMRQAAANLEARIDEDVRARLAGAGERPAAPDLEHLVEALGAPGGPLEVGREIERELERDGRLTRRPRPARAPAPESLSPPAARPAPAEGTREVRVMVCGSRSLTETNLLRAKLDEVGQRIGGAPMRVVVGDSRGADREALRWCEDAGVPCDVYEAAWDEEGRGAGYRRNERMVAEAGAHVLVAFPRDEDTPLCEHLIMHAGEAEVPVETVDEHGVTRTSDAQLTDLGAIGRRTGDDRGAVEGDRGEQLETYDPIREIGGGGDLETAGRHGPHDAPAAADTAERAAARGHESAAHARL